MPAPDEEMSTAIAKLKQAIADKNSKQLKKVLSSFSLLRDKSLSAEMLSDPSKKEDLDNIRQLFTVFSKVRSPEMIYAILAAGFSVFDLGTIFKSNKAIKSYIMLTNMLPNLTHKQVANLDGDEFPVCAYTRFAARIPVKGLGINYDLHSIFNALREAFGPDIIGQTTNLGFNNAIFQHDKLELDLELIKKVLKHINSEPTTNAQCIENINDDLDAFKKGISEQLKDIQFKSYCFLAYSVLVVAFLFSAEMQIYKYLATLPEEEIVRLWNSYYTVLKLCSLLLQASLLPGGFYMMVNKHKYDELRADTKIKFEPEELAFDYHAAQQSLLRNIPQRFADEFSSESKPASLLFWKQAFDAKTGNPSSKQAPMSDATRNNRTLLRMT